MTLRQVALLFGISKSAADRTLSHPAPLLAISPVRRRREGTVHIVDGTLVPTRDRTVAASSKNYRYSTNLQVVIDAGSRLAWPSVTPSVTRYPAVAMTAGPSPSPVSTGPAMVFRPLADGGYQAPDRSSRTAKDEANSA